jgi:salicylate hydroxylase
LSQKQTQKEVADRLCLSHYQTAEVVSVDEHKGHVEDRHLTARYYRVHLQQALLSHIDSSQLHLGKSFQAVDFDSSIKKLVVKFLDGTSTTADILLGSDGIHSPIRTFFVPTSGTKWTGWVTFRSVFPLSHLAHIPDLPQEANHFWGPNRMMFMSKLGKDLFTVVGSYQSDPDAPDAPYKNSTWNSDGDVNVLKEYYKDWSPLIRAIVDAIPYTRVYPNAAAHGLNSWVLGDGRVTLAGDAAHAHGGAFAAGGSLAIDDAWAFAAAIQHVFPRSATELPNQADISRALNLYNKTRKAHTDRVLATVHAGNKTAIARLGRPETDEELRVRMKNRADVSWIHEHNVEAAFRDAVNSELNKIETRARL